MNCVVKQQRLLQRLQRLRQPKLRHFGAVPSTSMSYVSEVSQVSQSVASPCDTRFGDVSHGVSKENSRSVASVARSSEKTAKVKGGDVVVKQQCKKLALANSASPATLPERLRHLRHLGFSQKSSKEVNKLCSAKCRKTPCDSVATLATVGARASGAAGTGVRAVRWSPHGRGVPWALATDPGRPGCANGFNAGPWATGSASLSSVHGRSPWLIVGDGDSAQRRIAA